MQKRTVKRLIVKPSGSKATHYSTCKGLHVQSGSLYDEHETDSLLTAKADVCIAPSRDKHLFQIKYLFKSVQPLILHTHPKKPTHLPENQKIYSKPLLSSRAAAVSYHSVFFLLSQLSVPPLTLKHTNKQTSRHCYTKHTLQHIMWPI